jgi:hypothetical protein
MILPKIATDIVNHSLSSHPSPLLPPNSEVHHTASTTASTIRHQDSFSDFYEAYAEYDSILRDDRTNNELATNSQSTAANSLTTRKRDIILCYSIFVVTSVVTAIMNAAITIFGMGVGVGLILGDTIRGSASTTISSASRGVVNTTAVATSTTTTSHSLGETSVVVVRPATPHCRAAIRRIPHSRTAPQTTPIMARSSSSSIMPAQ